MKLMNAILRTKNNVVLGSIYIYYSGWLRNNTMAKRKKVVKPTAAEARRIKSRLQNKYPQMYESTVTSREERTLRGVRGKMDRKALLKMVGKKLKKIYRSN